MDGRAADSPLVSPSRLKENLEAQRLVCKGREGAPNQWGATTGEPDTSKDG
jgi:hypothetical protein